MALEFASRGWKVAGGARSTDDLETLRNKLQSDHFIDFLDVTDPAGVDSFASRTEEVLGVPDLLVNNAGLINRNAPLAEITPEEFSSVLSVNLGGIHNMIRSFVPKMIEKGQGIIANFSSYWGQSTAPEVAPYCATKWGVEGLTKWINSCSFQPRSHQYRYAPIHFWKPSEGLRDSQSMGSSCGY